MTRGYIVGGLWTFRGIRLRGILLRGIKNTFVNYAVYTSAVF